MQLLHGMKISEYLIFGEVDPVAHRAENLPELKRAEIRGNARLPAKEVRNRLDGAKLVGLVAIELEAHETVPQSGLPSSFAIKLEALVEELPRDPEIGSLDLLEGVFQCEQVLFG